MLVREFGKMAGIIVGDEIGDGSPHIPKESLGLFRANDEAAGENWQVAEQIVASPFLKLLAKAWCPVLETYLPTLDECTGEAAFCCGSDSSHHLAEEGGEMRVDGFTAKFVAFQSFTAAGCRMIQSTDGFVGKAEDCPLTGWHIPGEKTVPSNVRTEVEDTLGGNQVERRDLWEHRGLRIGGRQR